MNNEFAQRLLDQPLETVVDYYARHLNDNAHSFLKRNCLLADSNLRVGFADRTLGKQIPEKQLKLGREIREKLKRLELLKPSGHESLRGFVTVPLTDFDGQTTGIHGLRVDNQGKGQPQLTVGSGIFNATAFTSFDEIIICSSVLDAWTFHAAGFANAIAIQERSIDQEWFFGIKRVLLADPNLDELSFNAVASLELMRIHFPEGVAVNEYAIDHSGAPDTLGKRIRAATFIGQRAAEKAPEVSGNAEPTTEDEPAKKPPAASPAPKPVDEIAVEQSETETKLRIESRLWRVRGLERNTMPGVMKINLLIFNERNEHFHVDTLDLYHSRARRVYLKEAAEETGLSEHELRTDLGRVLLKLEELQEEQRTNGSNEPKPVEISEADRAEALRLLRDGNLLSCILTDFDACGIVGERTGKLAGYLAATSRLLDKPLGLVIQSSSAAGKSALADSVLRLIPPESQYAYSAMTCQSLYYLGHENLKHKVISIAEEEGIRGASYQLKLLQSEGKLSLVSTTKESGTGRTITERYQVDGPVALVMTTTALNLDPELMNRCLVVGVDESEEQTAAIHAAQRRADTLEGWDLAEQRERITHLHQNAQRLLRPIKVINPYADQLKFIGKQTRHRRDHQKYLALIKAVTLLHQYQRKTKERQSGDEVTEYIEVTRADIAMANQVADWALGRSIDELAWQTRRLLIQLHGWASQQAEKQGIETHEFQFSRRDARESLAWNNTQIGIHLNRLCDHEYVIAHSRGRGKLSRYSLLYDGRGDDGQPTMVGLVDPAKLKDPRSTGTTTNLTGQKPA